jgi:hypothetical protein
VRGEKGVGCLAWLSSRADNAFKRFDPSKAVLSPHLASITNQAARLDYIFCAIAAEIREYIRLIAALVLVKPSYFYVL